MENSPNIENTCVDFNTMIIPDNLLPMAQSAVRVRNETGLPSRCLSGNYPISRDKSNKTWCVNDTPF